MRFIINDDSVEWVERSETQQSKAVDRKSYGPRVAPYFSTLVSSAVRLSLSE